MKVVPLRLQPGDVLRQAPETWMGEQQEQAGCVISAIGSLSVAQLRFAGAAEATTIHGELEILSVSGTLSADGAQLHIAIADSKGAVIGGHLCSGSLVRTTTELVLGLLAEWHFWRDLDPATGYAELRIHSSGSWLRAGSRRSTCSYTSQATPALIPPVQSLRSSSTIDTVLAPMRRPRNRKRPSFSRRDVVEMVVGRLQRGLAQFHAVIAWL
ncbi:MULTISPECIES: PPC domain-containing DNA-binding protein [unclassified Cyanobium]|uniref:PPC domain-containing DNA-binding protein n=1 Tax=unclassified Cyanobium TaxID=2627006 RepID=UPI0037C129ED